MQYVCRLLVIYKFNSIFRWRGGEKALTKHFISVFKTSHAEIKSMFIRVLTKCHSYSLAYIMEVPAFGTLLKVIDTMWKKVHFFHHPSTASFSLKMAFTTLALFLWQIFYRVFWKLYHQTESSNGEGAETLLLPAQSISTNLRNKWTLHVQDMTIPSEPPEVPHYGWSHRTLSICPTHFPGRTITVEIVQLGVNFILCFSTAEPDMINKGDAS